MTAHMVLLFDFREDTGRQVFKSRRLQGVQVGTFAYLDTGDGVKKYICTRVFLGYNEKYYLADENHVEYKMAVGIIANYTCNDTKGSITIVEFAAVEQAKASGSAGR